MRYTVGFTNCKPALPAFAAMCDFLVSVRRQSNCRQSFAILVLLGALVGFSSVGQAASLEEIKARGYMSVATEDDFAPFEFFKDGKPTGFDHDMLEELRKYAPFEIKQDIMPWTGLLTSVLAGKYDLALTGAIVSDERLQAFDFAEPFASATHYAILRANDKRIKTVSDLSGLTLGVQAGSALMTRLPDLEKMLNASGGKIGKVMQYQSYPEAVADLANGRLDYVVNTRINSQALVRERPTIFAMGMPVSGAGFHAYPILKGNESLLEFMDGFMKHLRNNGRLKELQIKWFGEAMPDLPQVPLKSVEQFHQLTSVTQ